MKNIVAIIFIFVVLPTAVFAQTESIGDTGTTFEAKVLEILDEKTVSEDEKEFIQQDILIKGLDGEFKNREITIEGISDVLVTSQNTYKKGDKILVVETLDPDGNAIYYPSDFVRRTPLWVLLFAFIASVLIIAKMKGLRAILVLAVSVLVIIYFIVPRIVGGANPLLITIIGTTVIGMLAIFFTHGFNKKSKISFYGLLASLILVFLLSQIFVSMANLTGLGDEDAMFLAGFTGVAVDLRGLLLAGIIIGALGVLDDVVISQVSVVEQLKEAKKELSRKDIYKRAMKVGTDHINSMINTLFLAYAGASLPLLILFSLDGEVSFTFGQIVNNEAIATEIIRTLTGSIGLVLAVPIATYLAASAYSKKAK